MTGGARYAVIACSTCTEHWIVDRHTDQQTAECPRCGHRYQRHKRKVLAAADTIDAAQSLRAPLLREKATGTGDAHDVTLDDPTITSYQDMADRVADQTVQDLRAQRLEDETELDADALDDDPRLRRDPSRDALRKPGQPRLDAPNVASTSTREQVLQELVDAHLDTSYLQRANDDALERAGLDPDYVHTATERHLDDHDATNADHDDEDDTDAGDEDDAIEATVGERAGLQLVHSDDLPGTADVILDDVGPRFSEWLPEWTEQALPATAETVLDIVQQHQPGAVESKRLPQTLLTTLRSTYGITAGDGLYAHSAAEYAVHYAPENATIDQYATSMHERRQTRLRSTLLGIGTPGADHYDGLYGVATGPVRVQKYRDDPLSTVVHLDADAWLSLDDRATGRRALQALAAIAESNRVYLGYDSLLVIIEFVERYGNLLEMAGVDLTESLDAARDRCGEIDTDVSATAADDAYAWLPDATDDTQPVRLVSELSHAPDGAITRSDVLAHPDVDISENSFYAVKDDLVEAGLVEWDARRGGNQESRLILTTAGSLAAEYITSFYGLRDPLRAQLRTRLIAPHVSDAGAVGSRGENSEGEGDREGDALGGVAAIEAATTAEDWLAAASDAGFSELSSPRYVHWLTGPGDSLGAYGMHHRYTAAVTQPGVHLVDERIQEWNGRDADSAGDGRSTFVSDLESVDDEFLVHAQLALDPLVTLGRLANALLTPRVTCNILSESELGKEFEQLYDQGWEGIEDVESVDDLHDLLRDAAQIGWKNDDQRTVEALRTRYNGLRARLNSEVKRCSAMDPGETERVELFRDLHGILASMTQLLYASGRDTVFNIRVPQTYDLIRDEVYRKDFLEFLEKTVPKQAVYESGTGWHSWTRQTQEDRPEKLQWRRSPGIDESHPTGDLTASWIFTGPSMTALVDDVRRAVDAGVRNRSDGKRAPPALEVPVRDAMQPQVLAEVIEEFAGKKDYRVANAAVSEFPECDFDVDAWLVKSGRAQDIQRLLRVFLAALGSPDRPLAASPQHVAEALLHISESDRSIDYLTVSDIEYGIACLPPSVAFPQLGPVATSIVQELLLADEPLLPSTAIERSISKASTRRTWEDVRGELLALGIVEERSTGRNQHYTATLEPWWMPSRSGWRPPNVGEAMVAHDNAQEMLFELSCALGLDEVVDELFTWVDSMPSTREIYDASDALRRWRPVLEAAYAGREDLLDVPPPEQAEEIVVIGRYPDHADTPWYALDEPRETLQNPLYNSANTGAKSLYGD